MNFVGTKNKFIAMLDNYTPVMGIEKNGEDIFLSVKHGEFYKKFKVSEALFNPGEVDYQKACVDHLMYELCKHVVAKGECKEPDLDPNKASAHYVEPAKKAASAAIESATAMVTETVSDAATKLVEGVSEAASDAKDAVKSVFEKIGEGISAAKDAIFAKEEKLEDVAIPEGMTEIVHDETAEDIFEQDDEPNKGKKKKGKK